MGGGIDLHKFFWINEITEQVGDLRELSEEHSVAPYFIEEDQKTVYVNPLQVTIIEEINGKVMLRIEYERRLREVIREKCVTCDHFKGDPDNLDGHYERLCLDGRCWSYEKRDEDEE